MTDAAPQAVQACHELIVWFIPELNRFPRGRRFRQGDGLESAELEVLVDAAYSRSKQGALARADLRLETARHLLRLAHELRVIPTASTSTG